MLISLYLATTRHDSWRTAGGRHATHHVHDLDQTEREDDGQRLRVVSHRPLHTVVVLQQALEQAPLVRTLQRHWKPGDVRDFRWRRTGVRMFCFCKLTALSTSGAPGDEFPLLSGLPWWKITSDYAARWIEMTTIRGPMNQCVVSPWEDFTQRDWKPHYLSKTEERDQVSAGFKSRSQRELFWWNLQKLRTEKDPLSH